MFPSSYIQKMVLKWQNVINDLKYEHLRKKTYQSVCLLNIFLINNLSGRATTNLLSMNTKLCLSNIFPILSMIKSKLERKNLCFFSLRQQPNLKTIFLTLPFLLLHTPKIPVDPNGNNNWHECMEFLLVK